MINLAVINLKTLLKKIIKIGIVIVIIAMFLKLAKVIYSNIQKFDISSISQKENIKMIKDNIVVSKIFEPYNEENLSELKKILVAELAVFSGAEEELMEKENQEEILEFDNTEKNEVQDVTIEEVQVESAQQEINTEIQPSVQTAVIESNNKKDIYTDIYHNVQIKNESNYSLTEAMITPDISYSNKNGIIIYHTHTCESYTMAENSSYIESGNYRTTDLNYSVVRVGDELTNYLAGKGYTVVHDKTYHDYPAYTGSYTRSLSTITNLLSVYNTVDAVFDVHRDALRK